MIFLIGVFLGFCAITSLLWWVSPVGAIFFVLFVVIMIVVGLIDEYFFRKNYAGYFSRSSGSSDDSTGAFVAGAFIGSSFSDSSSSDSSSDSGGSE